MKKTKIIIALAICLIMVLNAGCSALTGRGYTTVAKNDNYKILTDNEYCYIRYSKAQKKELEEEAKFCQSLILPRYESVEAMKQGILQGNFTKEEQKSLQLCTRKNEDGDIRICNIEKMYDALLPAGCSIRYIEFDGFYMFKIDGDGLICNLYYNDKESYDRNFAYYYTRRLNGAAVIDTESYQGIPVTVYSAGYKCYDLSTEEKTLIVMEDYLNSVGSSDIPFAIRFFGEMNGTYFNGMICESGKMTIDHRPSVEWYQSIGLKPYVETETEQGSAE